MLLKWPIVPTRINQIFGVNGAYYQAHGINIEGHNGIDFSAFHGQIVRAAHDGLAYYEIDSNQGHGVVIRSNDLFEYQGEQRYYKTIYWHFCDPEKDPEFKSAIPNDGQGHPVKAGDIIGYADNTGLSTGDHLHFGLKPQMKGEADGTWYNTEQHNGYLGAIDPLPYLPFIYTFTKNFGFGAIGGDVYKLQEKLVSMGLASFKPTGFFGPKTRDAVIAFQKIYKIPSTGYVGLITRAQLSCV